MLNLPERLTHDQALPTLQSLSAAMDALPAGSTVVLDGGALRFFDSSVLGLLLSCRRHAQSRQLRFQTQAMPARLQRLAELYGLRACL
jgi:phospholipid transport system transporter-binding protein